jgi:hypothetical protein
MKTFWCKILKLFVAAVIVVTSGCNVHEWPEPLKFIDIKLKLKYATQMNVVGEDYDTRADGLFPTGRDMRYIIRAYPISENGNVSKSHSFEQVFVDRASDGYDFETLLSIAPGNYKFMVWSDIVPEGSTESDYYDARDFSKIQLKNHVANTDYRDAFRGFKEIFVESSVTKTKEPEVFEIEMSRPVGKFELVTTDIQEFIEKEEKVAKYRVTGSKGDSKGDSKVDINDYKIKIRYSGFMQDEYSMLTDDHINAHKYEFESTIIKINEFEASLGFDYIFVDKVPEKTTISIILFDKYGNLVSTSDDIPVSIARSQHTILRGKFLTSKASGGVYINPEFTDDHNFFFGMEAPAPVTPPAAPADSTAQGN